MAEKKSAPKKAAPKTAAKAPSKKAAAKPAAPKKAAAPAQSSPQQEKAEQAHEKDVERKLEKAEHQHQDPRGATHQHNPAPNALGVDPRKDQGAIKTRGVPRMNKVVNWFRRGRGR